MRINYALELILGKGGTVYILPIEEGYNLQVQARQAGIDSWDP
jgi:hypothetical protein